MSGRIRNGVLATRLIGATWRKSSHSGALGNCVELAPVGHEVMAIRNSRDPNGPALVYGWDQLAAFVTGVKDGEYDGILG